MKKIFSIIVVAVFAASMASAQGNNAIRQVLNAASVSSKTGVVSAIKNIVSSKLVPTNAQIVGTWKYQKPAIMFTSGNAIKQATAAALTSNLETRLQKDYLSRLGIVKGNMSMTFKSDKTFVITRSGKTVARGRYAVNGSEVSLTFVGRKTPCRLTPQLDNGTLVLVGDASKVKQFLESAGAKSGVQSLATLSSLSKGMSGVKVGVRLGK